MEKDIAQLASDPTQYDKRDVTWSQTGNKEFPDRKLFLEYLKPFLSSVKNKTVLDIGCGQGWLCDEIEKYGGTPVGVEPSIKNVQSAKKQYPNIKFIHSSFQDFNSYEKFDYIVAVMVLEHFLDLEKAFQKIKQLMKTDGKFVAIVGDFEKFTNGSSNHPIEREFIADGEVAISVKYDDSGTIRDIVRKINIYSENSSKAGLDLASDSAIIPPVWHHRYATHKDKPIFHLLTFHN